MHRTLHARTPSQTHLWSAIYVVEEALDVVAEELPCPVVVLANGSNSMRLHTYASVLCRFMCLHVMTALATHK